jgi:CO/xanthine dehydrogenase Mo-binding subunit
MDLEKAVEGGAPLVHEDLGTNLCVECSGRAGDPDRAFREADGVVSARLVQPRLIPNPLEPRAVVASYARGTGHLTLWLSTQAPHLEQTPPRHPLRQCIIKLTGCSRGKSPLGRRHFLPYARPGYYSM